MLAWLATTYFTDRYLPYVGYNIIRVLGVIALLVLSVWAFLEASSYVASHQPWYTSPLLVSLVIFWALFPPSYFFLEYLSIDNGSLELPKRGVFCTEESRTQYCAYILERTKTYADLASKIWAAVAAVIGATIAAASKVR